MLMVLTLVLGRNHKGRSITCFIPSYMDTEEIMGEMMWGRVWKCSQPISTQEGSDYCLENVSSVLGMCRDRGYKELYCILCMRPSHVQQAQDGTLTHFFCVHIVKTHMMLFYIAICLQIKTTNLHVLLRLLFNLK